MGFFFGYLALYIDFFYLCRVQFKKIDYYADIIGKCQNHV